VQKLCGVKLSVRNDYALKMQDETVRHRAY